MRRKCVTLRFLIKPANSLGRKVVFPLLTFALIAAAGFISLAQEPPATPVTVVRKEYPDDPEQMRKTIQLLSAEIESLRAKVMKLEQTLKSNSIRDRLAKEEQRGEEIQAQLVLVAEKEARLQSQMSEVAEQLRSGNIDQLQIVGSTRPEQVRETTRQRLSGEKERIQSQLDLIQQSRVRLQASLAVSDLLIQRFRAQLKSSLQP